jgi:EAL domain-containing protein (putative c-di-GMP-specific phosphodiesterase class I)
VLSALASSAWRPAGSSLEITEGVFLGESSETDTTFTALKEIGVRLALDDFGTATPRRLFAHRSSTVKSTSRSCVRDFSRVAQRRDHRGDRRACRSARMETTAEGVEYMDQLRLVRSLRVSHVQGWIYSKAISSSELADRLQKEDSSSSRRGLKSSGSDRQSVYARWASLTALIITAPSSATSPIGGADRWEFELAPPADRRRSGTGN